MTAQVILNPYAGRWYALRMKQDIEAAMKAAAIDYELVVTQGPGHGIELAAQAVEKGFRQVIAAGGDGTINEVVNGIFSFGLEHAQVPFGIIPLGSVNDMATNLKLPKDLFDAARVIAAGNYGLIDVCQVNNRYFVNNAAIGLEPYITFKQERIKRLKGAFRYLVAALQGIMDNPQWTMHLQWENGEFSGPVTLVTVGNSPLTGGIFYMAPHANPTDGKLTCVYGFMSGRGRILKLLPRTMKPGAGSYVEHPAIHEFHTTWLKVRSDQPTPAHADGEVISREIFEVEFRVHPSRLMLLMPKGSG